MTFSPGIAGLTWRLLVAALLIVSVARGQAAAQETPSSAPLSVYLDCPMFACDQDYIRTEVTYVAWVRDRAAADVHVLVTRQGTGGGGTEFTLAFLGLREFVAFGDTLRYVSSQSATADDIRRGLTRTITLGLVPFLSRTALAERLSISVAPAAARTEEGPAAQRDPWNLWVFRIGTNGFSNGERVSQFNSINGFLSASRTTEMWKLRFSGRENYRESKFEIGGKKSTFINRSYSFNQLVVRSVGARAAVGFGGEVGSSTHENKRLSWRFTPRVEYNIFPYSESTRRMLTASYFVGAEAFRYNEETIYFRLREDRPVHGININLSQNQPWGTVNVGAEAEQYLDKTNFNELSVFGGTGIRLFKGFSVNLNGHYASLRNQLYLPRRGATPEEILLQQRRLQTNYSYFASAGISYTFGSVFNPVVNPRFGRGDGGGGSCFCF